MNYLVLENDRAWICTEEDLRTWIEYTHGGIRIFRLCGLNDPVELYRRWFGNHYFLVDVYGNNEGV